MTKGRGSPKAAGGAQGRTSLPGAPRAACHFIIITLNSDFQIGRASWMHPMKDACPLPIVKSEFQGYNADCAQHCLREVALLLRR